MYVEATRIRDFFTERSRLRYTSTPRHALSIGEGCGELKREPGARLATRPGPYIKC